MNDIDSNSLDFERSLPTMLVGALDQCLPPYRAIFSAHGLTEQQWRVLRLLWEESELSSVEISSRTFISKTSLVGVLDRLEQRKIIVRWRDTKDRRMVRAKLTPQGLALREAIWPDLYAVHQRVESRLSQAEWRQFRDLLRKASGDE